MGPQRGDTVHTVRLRGRHAAQLMETILHHIQRMAAQFNLKLNEEKCELIHINTENDVHFVQQAGGPQKKVKVVKAAKYLGVVITEDG